MFFQNSISFFKLIFKRLQEMVQNLYLYTAMRDSRNQFRIIQKETSGFDFFLKKDNKKHSTYWGDGLGYRDCT